MYNLIISMTNSTTNFFIGFIILIALLFVGATIADLGIDLSLMDGPNVTGCKYRRHLPFINFWCSVLYVEFRTLNI